MDDTIHALASIPTQPDRRAQSHYLWGRPAVTPRFTADVVDHEMEIRLDQGLYRHLCFLCQPVPYAVPSTLNCSFELLTAPGTLVISGDMGTYSFSRLSDMFHFFDAPSGRINPDYWSQKVTAQDVHTPVKSFSQTRFRQVVREDFDDRKYDFDPADQQILWQSIDQHILQDPDTYHEIGAREALRSFKFQSFDYSSSDEWCFDDFSHHFLWCLEAIVFGIGRYREVTQRV